MKIPVRMIVLTPLFTALTIVGALIKIPFPLAPLTLQILFVLMSGFILGPKYGALSQLLYILLGLLGLPIFAYGGGFRYILDPTFGFLIGFIFMSYVAGKIFSKKKSLKNAILGGILGLFVCYTIGLPYLYMIFNYYLDTVKSVWSVIKGAMLIFLPGDIVKILIGSYLSIEVIKRIKVHLQPHSI